MPPYRFSVRTTKAADNELLDLYVQNPPLRNAITRASSRIDRILGMGPPNQGVSRPFPGYSNRREISIDLLRIGFHYTSNGLEVVVTGIALNPRPPHGSP